MMSIRHGLTIAIVLLIGTSCGDTAKPAGADSKAGTRDVERAAEPTSAGGGAAGSTPSGTWFSDVTASLGLAVEHVNGMSAKKYMPETLGSGAALGDFNGDGRLDLYLIHQSSLAAPETTAAVVNQLFLQREDGTFEDATARSGAAADGGFGQGCATADFDGDGDLDLYLVNLGANRLLRNDGKGSFVDVTEEAGVGDVGWGMSAAFLDYDRDGDPDLFLVNYVDFAVERNVDCFIGGQLAYCSPLAYKTVPNVLYRNDGAGRFRDVSKESGVGEHAGKGLGISLADFDADGFVDVYIANDAHANFLFQNQQDGTFVEVGLESGTAFNDAGVAEAGMGTDFSDLNGDGRPDILVTNLDNELNNVFVNEGDGLFGESARTSGMGAISNPFVGFGCRAFDYDLDGDEDVYIANGHITDNIELIDPKARYAQDDFLFINDGKGQFSEVLINSGEVSRRVGRGLAVGDIDNDGDADLVVTNNGQVPLVLRNDQASGNHWLGLDLVGKGAASDALGAIIRYRVGEEVRTYRLRQRGSFVSAHDRRVVLGLGRADAIADLEIQWPDGSKQKVAALDVDRYHRIRQP